MKLRDYQQRMIDRLYHWWREHNRTEDAPILVGPTGCGKSVVIAELVRLLFDTWPEDHPRTLVIVPSKELAEQNAEKLRMRLPQHISVGFYSASLNRKDAGADVIVATIGSIVNAWKVIGNIKCVIVDECHLIQPDGKEMGRYRQFLTNLSRICRFRVVGLTATPFRGNGVWLTDGEDPLFNGVACTVEVQELLDAGHLAPLVRPIDVIQTRIDTSDIKKTGGDYNMKALADRVQAYIKAICDETVALAADRQKWLAFCPSVVNAQEMACYFRSIGIEAEVVCGETPKVDRERFISDFRAGKIRCLVTVLALTTGFDVPDVDCLIWCRPTVSPVLYVQGSGRGMRIAPGKTDCLWLDFSDTTERMGPVDAIKGRKKQISAEREALAPHKICENCGERMPASMFDCPSCGHHHEPPEKEHQTVASDAPIMSQQLRPSIVEFNITKAEYSIHKKPGSPDSLRVDYYAGFLKACSEWVCFEHQGFAREKAVRWWAKRTNEPVPVLTMDAHFYVNSYSVPLPSVIHVNTKTKYPEIVKFEWSKHEPALA